MTTNYQASQAASVREEIATRRNELKELGAVARVGFFHYPGRHTNVSTTDAVTKAGRSQCVKGDNPAQAIADYARAIWGSGRLQRESRQENSDGTYTESFLVIV